ncbi:hypothetical protein GCM10010358_12710 [Streptomyces minutiscleroticus]|uniref:Uncharacterized protein n=1 Tax=Streptomyces minutiscleroticus TaxID=68238 RepID=A0A918KG90_9ACTN|nr:hypothetical protein GCM10010358_12710 [Streptomyces minutiscleroticus]
MSPPLVLWCAAVVHAGTARQESRRSAGRAEMALDLAHPAAAEREPERLKAIARRCGVES